MFPSLPYELQYQVLTCAGVECQSLLQFMKDRRTFQAAVDALFSCKTVAVYLGQFYKSDCDVRVSLDTYTAMKQRHSVMRRRRHIKVCVTGAVDVAMVAGAFESTSGVCMSVDAKLHETADYRLLEKTLEALGPERNTLDVKVWVANVPSDDLPKHTLTPPLIRSLDIHHDLPVSLHVQTPSSLESLTCTGGGTVAVSGDSHLNELLVPHAEITGTLDISSVTHLTLHTSDPNWWVNMFVGKTYPNLQQLVITSRAVLPLAPFASCLPKLSSVYISDRSGLTQLNNVESIRNFTRRYLEYEIF